MGDVGVWLTLAAFALAAGIVLFAFRKGRALAEALTGLGEAVEALRDRIAGLDAAAFRAAYKAIGPQIPGPLLGTTWRGYAASLIDLGEDSPLGAPCRASDYFDEETPNRAGINLRGYDAVPNQLIGFGLLVTFVGLAGAIWLAQRGSGDATQTLKALQELLAAAAFKFVTSIAAIGSALWFGAYKNRLYQDLDIRLEKLCVLLDARTVPASEAYLLARSHVELCDQTDILDRRDDDLAQAIATALEKTLRASLKDALSPIAGAIDSMGAQLGQQNIRALERMVGAFAEQLGGAAKIHSEALAVILQEAGSAMRDAPTAIGSAAEAFARLVDDEAVAFAARAGDASKRLDASLGIGAIALDAVARRIGNFHDSMATTENAFVGRLSSFSDGADTASEAIKSITMRLEAAAAAASQLDGLADRLAAAAVTVDSAARASEKAAGESAAAVTALAEGARAITAAASAVEGVSIQSAALTRELESTASAFEASMGTLDATIARVFERVAGALDSLDKRAA